MSEHSEHSRAWREGFRSFDRDATVANPYGGAGVYDGIRHKACYDQWKAGYAAAGDQCAAVTKDVVPNALRYYGGDGTKHLHVETHDGKVVAVWFRCQMLPFEQCPVDDVRAKDMDSAPINPELHGLHLRDLE